jgi:hypothetical protein
MHQTLVAGDKKGASQGQSPQPSKLLLQSTLPERTTIRYKNHSNRPQQLFTNCRCPESHTKHVRTPRGPPSRQL